MCIRDRLLPGLKLLDQQHLKQAKYSNIMSMKTSESRNLILGKNFRDCSENYNSENKKLNNGRKGEQMNQDYVNKNAFVFNRNFFSNTFQ